MFIIFALINFLLYSIYALASYSETIKNSNYFFPMCLTISFIGNFLWLIYVKNISDFSKIYVNGAIWDISIVVAFTILPLFFFKVNLKPVSYIGLILMLTGTGLMKFGEYKSNIEEKNLTQK